MIQSTLDVARTEFALMPEHVLISVLALLGLGGLLALAAVGAGASLAFGRRRLAGWIAAGAAAAVAIYAAVLLGTAMVSRDRTLAPGGRKYFCEIDCHLAYSLEAATAPGPETRIAVRTWFDPSTISSLRGNAPLTPNPRVAWVVDADGRRYLPSGQASGTDPASVSFDRPLRPGGSYRTTLVFALPAGIRRPRLFVGDRGFLESLLIGHESGPGHGKTYFSLP